MTLDQHGRAREGKCLCVFQESYLSPFTVFLFFAFLFFVFCFFPGVKLVRGKSLKFWK